MIKSLILTALLTSGVGANATPLLNKEAETEQTQIVERNNANIYAYADETSTSQNSQEITWTQTAEATFQNRINWQNQPLAKPNHYYLWQNKKSEITLRDPTTNATFIRGNFYQNQYLFRNSSYTGDEPGWIFDLPYVGQSFEENITNKYNTDLHTIQYTPYQNINSNNIAITLSTQLSAYLYTQSPWNYPVGTYQTMRVYLRNKYTLLQSTDNWQHIIDISITQNAEQNYNVFNELMSSQNGYTYNKINKTNEIYLGFWQASPVHNGEYEWQQSNGDLTRNTITFNVPINPKKTNYIAILKTTELVALNQNNDVIDFTHTDSDTFGVIDTFYGPNQYESNATNPNTNEVLANWGLTHNQVITFSGTYLPPITQEVIDIPGIMFNILSMPFTFVSTAFNLTIFPGTPYQINIGSIALMLFGLLVFIFLFKIILKVFK